MTDGAGLERELGEFFGGLSAAVEAGEERRLGREAAIRQELAEFFAGLTSEVEAEEEYRRGPEIGLQRELGEFFGGLIQVAREEEERRYRVTEELKRDLTGMFGLLEPTIAAATVAIKVMEERAREEQDRRTGRKFSAFDLVRTQELDLSRIFRGLLDPSGSHSQGDLFLSLLLEELNAAPGKAAEVLLKFQPPGGLASRVRREYPISTDTSGTSRGFIDLVVELEHNRWIGIENKPWALDQEEQVPRYLYALLEEACRTQPGGFEKNVFILYLSGDGSDPDLDVCSKRNRKLKPKAKERIRSLNEGGAYWRNWLTVPYRQRFLTPSVEGWLRRCYIECEADRVRGFLRDVLRYIQDKFANTQSY